MRSSRMSGIKDNRSVIQKQNGYNDIVVFNMFILSEIGHTIFQFDNSISQN